MNKGDDGIKETTSIQGPAHLDRDEPSDIEIVTNSRGNVTQPLEEIEVATSIFDPYNLNIEEPNPTTVPTVEEP